MISTLIRNEGLSTPPPGSNDYLVDTETNRVIYPYTKASNIIGLDNSSGTNSDEILSAIQQLEAKIDNIGSSASPTIDPDADILYYDTLITSNFGTSWNLVVSRGGTAVVNYTLPEDIYGIWRLTYSLYMPSAFSTNFPTVKDPIAEDITGTSFVINAPRVSKPIVQKQFTTFMNGYSGCSGIDVIKLTDISSGGWLTAGPYFPPNILLTTSATEMTIKLINTRIKILMERIKK